MVKPYLPKGSRTYKIHPRVPAEFRAVVGGTHVTRSLGTGDLRQAKRRVPAVLQKLYEEWGALLRKASPGLAGSSAGSVRITGKHGHYFDSVEHACAYLYETARISEQLKRAEASERIQKDPEAFWRGEIVPLPKGGLRRKGHVGDGRAGVQGLSP